MGKDVLHRSEREAVAILFSDVIGSTDYFSLHKGAMGYPSAAAEAPLASRTVGEFGGHVIREVGDAVMAEFSDPKQAVRAAVTMQRRLHDRGQQTPPGERFQLRIAVHFGLVDRFQGEVHGDTVNVAARIAKMAEPAQVLISSTLESEIRDLPDLPRHSLGLQNLKGASEPMEVFEVSWTASEAYKQLRHDATTACERGDFTLSGEILEPFLQRQKITDRYEVIQELGKGGMGTVHKVHDLNTGEILAVKVLNERIAKDPQALERFKREVVAARKVTHQNVCRIYDYTLTGEQACISMEFVDGTSLRDLLAQRGRLPQDEGLDLAIQLCEGLGECHRQGVTHRDLKPANVVITRSGIVKVMDFGIAQVPEVDGTGLTQPGVLLGTPAYMAPEQILGQADFRSDIYSLGLVLFEIFTGVAAMSSNDPRELISQQINRVPEVPRNLDPPVNQVLQAAILKCLAKRAGDRFQSMEEVKTALHRVLQPGSDSQPDISATESPVETGGWRNYRGVIAASSILLLAAVVALGLWGPGWLWPQTCKEQATIILGSFEDKTDKRDLAEATRDLFRNLLQGSSKVSLFSNDRLAEALARKRMTSTEQVTEALGLDICTREDVPFFLNGNITQAGVSYRLTARLFKSRGPIFSQTVNVASKEDLPSGAQSLLKTILEILGRPENCIPRKAGSAFLVTTASTEAWTLYKEGVLAMQRGQSEKARSLFQGAAEKDPEFAMAHLQVARLVAASGKNAEAEEWFRKAEQFSQNLSPREQFLITGYHRASLEDYDKALDSFTQLVARYPDDADAHFDLAYAHDHVGHLDQAIKSFQEGLKLDPTSERAWVALVLRLARANQNARAREEAVRAVGLGIQSPRLHWGRGLAFLGDDDFEKAGVEFELLGASENKRHRSLGQLLLGTKEIVEGKWRAAVARLEKSAAQDEEADPGNELIARYFLARLALLLDPNDNRGRAREQVKKMLSRPRNLQAEDFRRLGTLALRLRDSSSATDALLHLSEITRRTQSRTDKSFLFGLQGEMALARGQYKDAETYFLKSDGEYPRHISHQGLALLHEAQGRFQESADEWQKVIGEKGAILQHEFPADWILAHLEQARMFNKITPALGERRIAEVKQRWSKADPEVLERVLRPYSTK